MSRHNANTDDDDVTDDNDATDNEEEEEEEEPYLETLVRTILEKHADVLENYTSEPQTPEEIVSNDSIKKFVKLKTATKIMTSFACMLTWEREKQLIKLYKECKRMMKHDKEMEAEDAMKHTIKKNNSLVDIIEKAIEDAIGEDEDMDVEEDTEE